jgi:hypothetical protein
MTSPTPLLRRSAAAVFAGALLLTACGSSGGSDSEKKTTTTAAKATTTEAEKTSTTADDADPGADGPTAAELETVLPEPTELGDGWVEDDSEAGPDAAIETATKTECPDAAALLAPAEDDEVTRAYTGPAGESVRVTLAEGVDPIDPDAIQGVVDSINDCDAVTAEEGGVTYTASFDAAPNSDYGDGVQIAVSVNLNDGTDSIDVTKYRLLYTVGNVGVTITGGDGLADDGTVTPIDVNGLDAIAAEIATRVGAL